MNNWHSKWRRTSTFSMQSTLLKEDSNLATNAVQAEVAADPAAQSSVAETIPTGFRIVTRQRHAAGHMCTVRRKSNVVPMAPSSG